MVLDSTFARLDVEVMDGIYTVELRSGERRPIIHDGNPLRGFLFGWSALHVVDLGIDLFLLELRFHDGHRATWFLDRDLNRLCDQVHYLPEPLRLQLLDVLFPYLHATYHTLLSSPTPAPPAGARVVGQICEPTIRNIVRVLLPRIAPELRIRRPGSTLSDVEGFNSDSLHAELQPALDHALSGQDMRWSSPFDGTVQSGNSSIPATENRIGYRFQDVNSGNLFYVGSTHHAFRAADIFIPALQCLLVDVPDDTTGRNSPAEAVEEYLTHAATHAVDLCHYLATTTRSTAVVIRGFPGMHMGHHIWNDLTALDRLQRTIPAKKLPIVIVPDADNGSEPFAPIEEILPAFAGKVDRSHAFRQETLGSLTYRRNLFLARSMDEHVSTHLSRRIREATLARPTTRADRLSAQDYRDRGYTIITLGMRVENRTATDIVDVAQTIIDHLSTRIEKLVVVLDGQNARLDEDPTTCFGSYGQPAHLHPLLREFDLVLKLRQRYHYTDIKIVSTIGASMPKSIVWCDASAAFIAFWGAGFAKYRWVCNKPGLALSGHWNLSHRRDLRIYDTPQWQEAPTRLMFIDPACVTDRPDLGVYFSIVSPVPITYANFEIDPNGLRNHIDRLLDSLDLI